MTYFGGLAQLARAPALHAGGQRFESVILHTILKKADQATAWSAFSFLFTLAPIEHLSLLLDFLHKGDIPIIYYGVSLELGRAFTPFCYLCRQKKRSVDIVYRLIPG